MKWKKAAIVSLLLAISAVDGTAQTANDVKIVGAMRNVMWKGQLYGNINLDTIANKKHLYGLGPVAYLAGEVLIIDGRAYKSMVVTDSTMKTEETFAIEAPFFGYANIPSWKEQSLPDSIRNLKQLEQYIIGISKALPQPFLFRLSGTVEQATIHIVNLPKGATVSSPDEAHRGQVNYNLENVASDIVGFFSTKHKAVFTHHDTYLHMHLITADRQKMGHLDSVLFKPRSMKLYLPAE